MQLNILQISSPADFTVKPSQDVYRVQILPEQTTLGLLKLDLLDSYAYQELLADSSINFLVYETAINKMLGDFPVDTLVTAVADVITSAICEQMFVFIEVIGGNKFNLQGTQTGRFSSKDTNKSSEPTTLGERLTNEVLTTMAKAVKTCGWELGHIESASFVEWCYIVAGKECPDLTPYDN